MNYIEREIEKDIAASRGFWAVTLAVTTLIVLITGFCIFLDRIL